MAAIHMLTVKTTGGNAQATCACGWAGTVQTVQAGDTSTVKKFTASGVVWQGQIDRATAEWRAHPTA